ncbi:bifunctional NAD(P)/FAD-dependent oxidoreductase/class I SAM-dependent methyltransferase [Actinoplanes couchii]|uniref:Methyltransferase n=1 Tax=Actinoplanes couchii TaxID=403638 RepID=A0ABQ3X085_9ACTN|nr:bifunctional NAD(P)/FAD-dependent oxidoreductase/class I SAM-dependent methyltransferase [Actinoplanes couchii]MDR6316252.1 thioredoxin reductase/2-polyprenyl-3-methyl-5-hydroxy-6-metoxy-1,4-benzoquinol methylase [Actinoplanes couchii]GID51866.1 methyltransferase [Actinoplanes couchii]
MAVEEQDYDVVVIGGGAAGLSGALALARSRRSVLVVDSGEPRNAPAGHMHNVLGRDGVPPGELLAAGRAEVEGYGARFEPARAESAVKDEDGFRVTLEGGRVVRGRRLLVTTGLVDELPQVPGLADRWGRDVAHCPYCHGWELRDQRIGVIVSGPMSVHQAQMWRQLSDRVMLLLNGSAEPAGEKAEELAARGIPVVPGVIEALETGDDRLTGVRLAGGHVVGLDAIVVGPRFAARSGFAESLGLKAAEFEMHGISLGSRIPADEMGATSVPGVWVAGNVTNLGATVGVAMAAGQTAGAAINMDLIAEDTRVAVAGYRDRIATMFEENAWEDRYRGKDAIWSGRPNPVLVTEATGLDTGRALDVGCGEGADAVWLARQGWQVTAVDISTVALGRAAGHAQEAGVGDRITFRHTDLRSEQDQPIAEYDLVSAQFMHLPPDARRELYTRLAGAVAPGGILLVAGHHPRDLAGFVGRMHFPDMLFTPEEIAGLLTPGQWEIVTAEARPRPGRDPEGNEITMHDAVLVARRTGPKKG